MKWLIAIGVVLVGLIVWACVETNKWENKCEEFGGEVVSEYVATVNNQDIYNYYCMRDGVEINV